MRIHVLILAAAVGVLLLASAGAQDGQAQPRKPESRQSSDKVKDLRAERIATLQTMVEVETALLKNGRASARPAGPEAVLEARVLVCEAEFDAAERDSDRIAALKRLVEMLTKLEETAEARKNAAEATEIPVLKVRARRLEAEIRLALLSRETDAQGAGLGQERNVEPGHEKHDKAVVARLQAKDVVIVEQFVCQIQSRRHIDVRSQQSGYLEEIQVKEGQAVKQGDVMFKIAPFAFQARLDVEMAEVQVATLNLKNTERLFQNKAVSEDEVALVRAKLAGAQAKANLARAELSLTVVRAPFDGLIDRLQQQQGSLVTEREILTTLSDNSAMWVYFNVPQACYLEFVTGPAKIQDVEVELALAGGRKFPQAGKLAAIEAQFQKETGTIPFRADFPNPDGLLRHGMAGTVLIHRTLKSVLVVPQRATFEIMGKRYVYVLDKENVVHQREIAVQRALADDFVVAKGLDANDRIVVEGVRRLRDGEKLPSEQNEP